MWVRYHTGRIWYYGICRHTVNRIVTVLCKDKNCTAKRRTYLFELKEVRSGRKVLRKKKNREYSGNYRFVNSIPGKQNGCSAKSTDGDRYYDRWDIWQSLPIMLIRQKLEKTWQVEIKQFSGKTELTLPRQRHSFIIHRKQNIRRCVPWIYGKSQKTGGWIFWLRKWI